MKTISKKLSKDAIIKSLTIDVAREKERGDDWQISYNRLADMLKPHANNNQLFGRSDEAPSSTLSRLLSEKECSRVSNDILCGELNRLTGLMETLITGARVEKTSFTDLERQR